MADLTTTGNVGIGTTSPSYPLAVFANSGSWAAQFENTASSGAAQVYLAHGEGYGAYIDAGSNATSSTFALDVNKQGTPYLYVRGNGNVGVGTASPGARLSVSGASTYNEPFASGTLFVANSADTNRGVDIGYDPNLEAGFIQAGKSGTAYEPLLLNPNAGSVGIGTTSPSYPLDVNGSVHAASFISPSDKRWKRKIAPLPSRSIRLVQELRPVSFEWKHPVDGSMKGKQLGFVAQEVEEILPSAVLTQADAKKTKGIKYNEIVVLLTKAVQEQQAQIDALKAEIAKLMSPKSTTLASSGAA
jgi:hypothetical protein